MNDFKHFDVRGKMKALDRTFSQTIRTIKLENSNKNRNFSSRRNPRIRRNVHSPQLLRVRGGIAR